MEIYIDDFIDNINRRLSLAYESEKQEYLTEDCFRYDLFASYLTNKIPSELIHLEYPHEIGSKGKKIDSVVFNSDNITSFNKPIAFEMKYLKSVTTSSPDRTGKLAEVISDFIKLNLVKEDFIKYIVFISNKIINTYITNDNGFKEFYSANEGEVIKVSKSMKKNSVNHFNKTLEKNFKKDKHESISAMEIDVEKIHYSKLKEEHHLYVFKII